MLATPDRYRGAGQGGADCYTELRRIPIPRTWLNKGKEKDRSVDAPVLLE